MKYLGPLLAIRADASHRIGTGHIMRTLAIAQAWIARGGRVLFLCAQLPETLAERLLSTGAELICFDPSDDSVATAASAISHKAVVVLIDSYGLDESWWRALPANVRWRTAALNDFRKPTHPLAQLGIFPRAVSLPNEPYSGPAFLLIRSEIHRTSPIVPPPVKAVRLLLVLGGADPENAGPKTAVAILSSQPDIALRVIVGPAAGNLTEFLDLALSNHRLEVVRSPESMRPHYEWADTAVVSPSTTAFEVLHHGLVTGLIITAGNQEEVGIDLTSNRCAVLLADARQTEWRIDSDKLEALISDETLRYDLSNNGANMVDGRGAERVCDILGLPDISFRPATNEDARLIWEWANDPQSRAASFSSEPIDWVTHVSWFQKRLASTDPVWLAIDSAGEPLAFMRFDPSDEKNIHIVSINLAPSIRGRDLSALIVHRALVAFRARHPLAVIHAWIKETNLSSRRCFAKAGFHEMIGVGNPDRLLYQQIP